MDNLRSLAVTMAYSTVDISSALFEAQKLGVNFDILHLCCNEDITQSLSALWLQTKFSSKEMLFLFRRLEDKGMIDHALFIDAICSSLMKLSLESLEVLIGEAILPIGIILTNKVASQHLLTILSSCTTASKKALQGLIRILLNEAFPVNETAQKFLSDIIIACCDKESWTSECYTPLQAINDSSDISLDIVKAAHVYLLSQILTRNPEISVCEAVQMQPKLHYQHLSNMHLSFFSKLGTPLDTRTLVSKLKETLSQQLNWKSLLQCVTCNIHLRPSFRKYFTDVLVEIAKHAVMESNQLLLTSTIILARHIDKFYPDFLKQLFGKNKLSILTSKVGLNFLVDALTLLVPYEHSEFLKVHLDIFSRRDTSHSFLTEYSQLARTRLRDLGDITTDNNEAAASLLQQAVAHFQSSGSILKKVIEVSIFRSPFFIGSFLPLLLAAADTEPLVLELFKLGKIPKKMFLDYQNALQEGPLMCKAVVPECELNSVDELIHVLACDTKPVDIRHRLIQVIPPDKHAAITGDLSAPNLYSWQITLVDRIISDVCHEVSHYSKSRWVGLLLDALAKIDSILWPLLVRLWEILTKQISTLTPVFIKGLACILFHCCISTSMFDQALHLKLPSTALRTFVEWAELTLESIPQTRTNLIATYQLSANFLLCSRQFGTPRHSENVVAKCAFIAYRYSAMKQLPLHNEQLQFSYSQWLKWEFQINLDDDFLLQHERMVYLQSTFKLFFANLKQGGDQQTALNELFVLLLRPFLPGYKFALALFIDVLEATNDCSSSCSPLFEAVNFVLQSEECGSAITKVLCDVPARLFCPRDLEFSGLANCLPSIQALRLDRGSFLLPSSFVFHLTRVLGKDTVVDKFCHSSHLYYSSLLVALIDCPQVVARSYNIPSDLIEKAPLNISTMQTLGLPPEVNAVVLFHMINTPSLIFLLQSAPEKVLAGFCDLCVRHLAGSMLQLSSDVDRLLLLATECINSNPKLICVTHIDVHFSDNQKFLSTFRTMFPHRDVKLLPYIFFKLLSKLSEDTFTKLLMVHSFLPLCITNHSQLMELQHVAHIHGYQAFDNHFMTYCTRTVKKVLESASQESLEMYKCHWTVKHFLQHF